MSTHSTSSPLDQDYRDLLAMLSYVYLQIGHPNRSLILLTALHEIDPEDQSIFNLLACAFIRCGQAHEALPLLECLIEQGNPSPLVHLLHSQALANLGWPEQSAHSMQTFIATRARQQMIGG